jgi:hypothetical protein
MLVADRNRKGALFILLSDITTIARPPGWDEEAGSEGQSWTPLLF